MFKSLQRTWASGSICVFCFTAEWCFLVLFELILGKLNARFTWEFKPQVQLDLALHWHTPGLKVGCWRSSLWGILVLVLHVPFGPWTLPRDSIWSPWFRWVLVLPLCLSSALFPIPGPGCVPTRSNARLWVLTLMWNLIQIKSDVFYQTPKNM